MRGIVSRNIRSALGVRGQCVERIGREQSQCGKQIKSRSAVRVL